MSLRALKLELDARSGSDLFPANFSMDLLISLTREIALHETGAHTYADFIFMNAMLSSYFERITAMQGTTLLQLLSLNLEKLLPTLAHELLNSLSEEIVSKLIDFDVRTDSFRGRAILAIEANTEV